MDKKTDSRNLSGLGQAHPLSAKHNSRVISDMGEDRNNSLRQRIQNPNKEKKLKFEEVTPELLAQIVRSFILPMFDTRPNPH